MKKIVRTLQEERMATRPNIYRNKRKYHRPSAKSEIQRQSNREQET